MGVPSNNCRTRVAAQAMMAYGGAYGMPALQEDGRAIFEKALGEAPLQPDGTPYNHKAPPTQPTQGFLGGVWGHSMPLARGRMPGVGTVCEAQHTQHTQHTNTQTHAMGR